MVPVADCSFPSHVRPLLVRDDVIATQRPDASLPDSGLPPKRRLPSIAASSSSRMSLTAQRLQTRQFPGHKFSSASRRALSISALADCSICVSPAAKWHGRLLHGVKPVCRRCGDHGAELTVEGFKLDPAARLLLFHSTSIRVPASAAAVQLYCSAPALPRRKTPVLSAAPTGSALFFNSEWCFRRTVSPERIRSSPLRMSGCSCNRASSRDRATSRSNAIVLCRLPGRSGKIRHQHVVGRRQHDQVVAATSR